MIMMGEFSVVAQKTQYGLVNFVLLWAFEYNRYSADRRIRGSFPVDRHAWREPLRRNVVC
jgi:hypothetical protein